MAGLPVRLGSADAFEDGVEEFGAAFFEIAGGILEHRLPVVAEDPDGQVLSFSADHLPPGARFDSQTGVLEWTPGPHDAGEYKGVEFSVSDGTNTVTSTVTFIVTPVNAAPVLKGIPDRTVRQGDALRFTVTADDADGDPLTYSTPDLLPGMSLDPNTGVFEWTPPYNVAGSFDIRFDASDG